MMQGRFFVNALFPAWWRDPNMGGGQLIEQAIHVYDLARYFLGEAQTVTAFADNLHHRRFADYRVDDVSASTIRFANGSLASLCAANCAEPCAASNRMTVLCEKVMVEFATPEEATFIYHGGKVSEEISNGAGKVTREQVITDGNGYEELTRNFIAGLRENEPLRSSIDDGVESLRLVLAAAQSARLGGLPQAL
jgi:predicted dehydrogenase